MGTTKTEHWIESALQAMAFWMGYEKELFPSYDLPELALGAEFCRLLRHFAPKELKIKAEQNYGELLGIKSNDRADIAIFNKENDNCEYIIEIKRNGSHSIIKKDIQRLQQTKKKLPNAKQYSVVFSEKRLKDFVKEDGTANKQDANGKNYRVRRVCKAAPSFRSEKNSFYAILIEIL